jgi:Pyruvate/2-oxoacid:ferredoxin oxidoreductase delta subunit
MPVENVLAAIGQQADTRFLPEKVRSEWQALTNGEAVNIDGQWVIGAGDITTGPTTVVDAIGSGKHAAASVDALIQGLEPPKVTRPEPVSFDALNTGYFNHVVRQESLALNPASRIKGFDEVVPGLSDDALLVEAERCFHCGDCNFCGNCWIFCPEMSIDIDPDVVGPNGLPRFQIDYRTCKGCGICVQECPPGAIVMEEEVR